MKYLFMLFLINNIYALDRSYSETQQLYDFRSTVIFDELNSSGSSGNTLGEDKIRDLRIGDYLQLENKEQYILKTVSRHLLVEDFKLVNKFKKISNELDSKISQLEEAMEDYDRNELLKELETSIKPFEVDDF